MGLFNFLRRKGRADAPQAQAPTDSRDRDEASVAAPGFAAEGPPVGTSDPGALTGEDAGDVVGGDEPNA
ncbi:MAG: hypothetical protein M3312_03630 [Actinomycetota bacterium]|nr:hypothetical protein [Actinomycetota bacterium]